MWYVFEGKYQRESKLYAKGVTSNVDAAKMKADDAVAAMSSKYANTRAGGMIWSDDPEWWEEWGTVFEEDFWSIVARAKQLMRDDMANGSFNDFYVEETNGRKYLTVDAVEDYSVEALAQFGYPYNDEAESRVSLELIGDVDEYPEYRHAKKGDNMAMRQYSRKANRRRSLKSMRHKRQSGFYRKADITMSDCVLVDETYLGADAGSLRSYVVVFYDGTFLLLDGWGYPTSDGGSIWSWSLWDNTVTWQQVIDDGLQILYSPACFDYGDEGNEFRSVQEALDDFNEVWSHPSAVKVTKRQIRRAMTEDDVIDTIRELSRSQGFYGRLYDDIMSDPMFYDQFMDFVMSQAPEDPVDLVMLIEL